jgi:fructose-bisphosphate aldolase class II
MSIVTLRDILRGASLNNYGVGLFNFLNLEMLRGIVKAANEEKSPLILGVAEVHLPVIPLDWAVHMMQKVKNEIDVPICLHLDHGTSKDTIFKAIHSGFTSVMYDGSALPYEENIANTKEIVAEARKYGVSVEAELGHVGGAEGGGDDGHEANYTNVSQVIDFVNRTDIDALAVAIGTAHGKYTVKPVLDLERLKEIKKVSKVPLVLHGGSGLSDDDFRNTIKYGISKVNICTDMCYAALGACQNSQNIEVAINSGVDAVANVVKEKMRLFGSSGKVSSIGGGFTFQAYKF